MEPYDTGLGYWREHAPEYAETLEPERIDLSVCVDCLVIDANGTDEVEPEAVARFEAASTRISVVAHQRLRLTSRKAGTMDAAKFFAEHAGYSYDSKVESAEDGKARNGRMLAEAETWGKANGLYFRWEDDWSVGSHFQEYGEAYADGEPETCEAAFALRDCPTCDQPQVVASLHCIDGADADYRRVIEAELASEAFSEIVSQQV